MNNRLYKKVRNIVVSNKKLAILGVVSISAFAFVVLTNQGPTNETMKQEEMNNLMVESDQSILSSNDHNKTTLEVGSYLKEKNFVKENKDLYQVKAVELKLNNAVYYLENLEDLKTVLEQSQESLLSADHNVDIQVNISNNELETVDFQIIGHDDCETELKSITVLEDISIDWKFVSKNAVHDVATTVNHITKLNDSPETYDIAQGDVPSIIAQNYGMNLSELYELNPGLKEKSTRIQIGDKLVVNVPKPDMTIQTEEIIVYKKAIPKDFVKKESSDYYRGTSKTVDNGSDGEMEVTATIKKVNGVESDREIIEETVVSEPVSGIILVGSKPLPPKGSLGTFVSPLADYVLTSEFGPRWSKQHKGIDMAAPMYTTVRASDGGVVTYSGWLGTYGYLIVIDHGNGVKTKYGHNSKLSVKVGDYVSQYQEVAKVGSTGNSTGPHVHFEILFDNTNVNPLLYLE